MAFLASICNALRTPDGSKWISIGFDGAALKAEVEKRPWVHTQEIQSQGKLRGSRDGVSHAGSRAVVENRQTSYANRKRQPKPIPESPTRRGLEDET